MELNFLEYEKRKVWNKKEDREEEVEDAVPIPFETHPHELASSVALRYAYFRVKQFRMPVPPPNTGFYLRNGTRGTTIEGEITVKELVKEHGLLVQLAVRMPEQRPLKSGRS